MQVTTQLGARKLANSGGDGQAKSSEDERNAVYIIRHAEKQCPSCCLSRLGLARAKNLLFVFSGKPSRRFAAPKAIFAHTFADGTNCERCHETVAPLAAARGLVADYSHGGEAHAHGCCAGPNGGNKGAALAIKKALNSTGGPVLVSWESANVHHLVLALGLDNAPAWYNTPGPDDDYDSVWMLSFDVAQNVLSIKFASQHFP